MSSKVNRCAYLTSGAVPMPDYGIAMEIHSCITIGRHQGKANYFRDPGHKLKQQGVNCRIIGNSRGGWDVIVPERLAAPVLEQQSLVQDTSQARLNQTLDEQMTSLAQVGIHRRIIPRCSGA